MMNLSRVTFTILLALQATLMAAIASDTFPKWSRVLALGLVFIGTVVQAFSDKVQTPTVAEAKKAASLPPVALGALMFALTACTPVLTPADEADIAGYDSMLAKCRAIGLDAGKVAGLATYKSCVAEGGK